MAQLKVTQVKSTIGNKRIHHSVVVEDNAVNRGYINRATHLLVFEEVGAGGEEKAGEVTS